MAPNYVIQKETNGAGPCESGEQKRLEGSPFGGLFLCHLEGYMQLYRGDCLEVMKRIKDHSVDAVICDLPYGVTDYEWDQILDGKRLFEEYKRVCKQNANVLLFCQIEFAKYLLDSAYKSEFSHCLIWEKPTTTRFLSSKNVPMSKYEMILCFRVNKYWNKDSHKELRNYFVRELSESGKTVKELKAEMQNRSAHHWFCYSSDFRVPTERNYKRLQEVTGRFARPYWEIRAAFDREKNNRCTFHREHVGCDILKFGLTEKRVHPTQKPVALMEVLVSAYSNKGDVILDNCMGSGSTGVACVNTERDFIGIELDQRYFETAKQRIEEAQVQERVWSYHATAKK